MRLWSLRTGALLTPHTPDSLPSVSPWRPTPPADYAYKAFEAPFSQPVTALAVTQVGTTGEVFMNVAVDSGGQGEVMRFGMGRRGRSSKC